MVKKYMAVLLVVFGACCIFSGRNTPSIEDVDYAAAISILTENGAKNEFKIRLYVADLEEYRGSSRQMLETKVYTCDVSAVSEIFELYQEENGRELSLSHVKKISAGSDESLNRILAELADYVDISDEVSLETANGETGLRTYICKKNSLP